MQFTSGKEAGFIAMLQDYAKTRMKDGAWFQDDLINLRNNNFYPKNKKAFFGSRTLS